MEFYFLKEIELSGSKVGRELFIKLKIFYFCQSVRRIEGVQQRIIGPARQKNPPPVLLCPTRGILLVFAPVAMS